MAVVTRMMMSWLSAGRYNLDSQQPVVRPRLQVNTGEVPAQLGTVPLICSVPLNLDLC